MTRLLAPAGALLVSLLLVPLLLGAGCSPHATAPRDAGVPTGRPDAAMASLDPDKDNDGDHFTRNEGDCDDGNTQVFPGAPEACNGFDDDCDGKVDETCDYDADNYTPEGGDCDDQEKLVNPGAYEVSGNDVDDDCDQLIDEPTEACDTGRDNKAATLAGAFELCPPWLMKSSVNLDAASQARGVFASFGSSYRPKAGSNFAVLSTGVAAAEKDHGYVDPQPGTEFANDAPNPARMDTKNNICGMSFSDEATVHDYLELTYTLQVPTNAHSFSFQFNFLSSEYPEWVGSEFNDKFLVLLDSKAYKGNISFDRNKNPITVNVGFFQVCESSEICEGQKINTCKTPVKELAGTGYELDDGTGIPMGGATGWLTTTSPVQPGEVATLRFIIFDEGDHMLDSAVVIDNFQWQLTAAPGPNTIP